MVLTKGETQARAESYRDGLRQWLLPPGDKILDSSSDECPGCEHYPLRVKLSIYSASA